MTATMPGTSRWSGRGRPGHPSSSRRAACCAPGSCARRPRRSCGAVRRPGARAEGARLGLHQPVAHRMIPFSVITASSGTSWAAARCARAPGTRRRGRSGAARARRWRSMPEREGTVVEARRRCRGAGRGGRSPPAAGTPGRASVPRSMAAPSGSSIPRRLRRSGAAQLEEAHAARGARPVDARQVDAAAAPLRQLDERGGVQLARQGGVDRDAPARPSGAGRGRRCAATPRAPRARARRGVTARRRATRLARSDLRAASGEESGSATRLCRCGPLLSNQSNRWDELRQVRLSARRRTCTVLHASPKSRGVSIRVRGNPVRLSNTAGDARTTLHQGCVACL